MGSRTELARLAAVAGAVFAAGILGAPATASAATFFVDDSATTPLNPCTSAIPANACQTIDAAITQARGVGFPVGDTIMIAAGNYPEDVPLHHPADAGNTLDGAGSGTGATSSVIAIPNGEFFYLWESNLTVRDIAILGSNTETVYIGNATSTGPTGNTMDNVQVVMDNPNTASAIHVDRASNTTLNNVHVEGDSDWDGAGDGPDALALKVQNASNLTVNDSELFSNSRTVLSRGNSTVKINRSIIGGPVDFGEIAVSVLSDLVGGTNSLTLDSSLVILGSRGVDVSTNTGTASASALIRNSTIDPGLPKGTPDLVGAATTRIGSAGIGFESSIVVGALSTSGAGAGSMTCSHTDAANTVVTGINCQTTPGNPNSNSSNTPAALFVPGGFLGLDWHLLSTSPAIDAGVPGALAPADSTTDVDGDPRLLDGNFDCVARRDMGAYEVTGQSAACPAPAAPGPAPAAPGTNPTSGNPSAGSTKKKCKRKKRTKAALAAKKKSCKRKKRAG